MPAGAIRVAPTEDSVEGTIVFPPSQWDGRPVEGLKLRFSKGRVVEVIAASGKDAVEAEMRTAGDAGRAFREFALGFNPLASRRRRGFPITATAPASFGCRSATTRARQASS